MRIYKDTKIIGNITELEVQTYVTKLNIQVSIPYGDRARYDQIWDVNGKLLKIQIKHANVSEDKKTFSIKCVSDTRKDGKRIRVQYSNDEIDAFATFFNDKVYYIPISEKTRGIKTLRVINETKSNINATINWASDFEVEKQLKLH